MLDFKNKYPPHYTYADYVQWEGRWELIDGVPYAMSPQPSMRHQKLNYRIGAQLDIAMDGCDKCEFYIPIDWKISDTITVQPDIVVVCKPFEEGVFLTKTPDIIFEILSPSTAEKDRTLKYELYEKAGVKYYIIVSPKDKTAEVFTLNNNQYQPAGTFTSGIYHFAISGCAFDFDFGKIW